jgi:murein DD-endopeptidase MepM/ murein hydrolase activator NlpD
MDTNFALPTSVRATLVAGLTSLAVLIPTPATAIAADASEYATPIPPRSTPPTLLIRVGAVRASENEPRTIEVPVVVDEPVRMRATVLEPGGRARAAALVRRAGGTFLTIPVRHTAAFVRAFDRHRAVPIHVRLAARDSDGERDAIFARVRVLAPRDYVPSTQMLTPMPGFAITSGFGQRWGRLHAGVDIPAPTGTTISAARAGVVTSVAQDGGYGLATTVDHGSYSTFYAHQSASFVHVGQHVARGQAIGAVGTTGSTTGAHLHFEVHVGGVAHDPMGWL